MSYTFRFVRSLKGSLPDVWASILRARTFVVRPHQSLRIQGLQDSELRSGELVCAKLAVGPFVLRDAWAIETHDRDDQGVVLRGAEGFEHRLLWDYEVRVGEAGRRCIVDYRVRLPGRRTVLPFGIGVGPVFRRRHYSLHSIVASMWRPAAGELLNTGDPAGPTRGEVDFWTGAVRPPCGASAGPLYPPLTSHAG